MSQTEFTAAAFYRHLADGRLMCSACRGCGHRHLPPHPICVCCGFTELEWHQLQGHGRLAAYTCISVAPSFMAKEGYDRTNPYCAGVVELADGLQVSARILGVEGQQPEAILPGTAVTLDILHDDADRPLPVVVFRVS